MRSLRRTTIAFGGGVGLIAAVFACGSGPLPHPKYVAHPQHALVEVPYPPPPARVEFVPERPNDDAVWVDGEWVWRGRRYAWKPGRWVDAPKDARFSPWTSIRNAEGTLYVAKGTWRDPNGKEIADPKALAIGGASAGSGGVVDPEGELVPPSPPNPAQEPPSVGSIDAGPPRPSDSRQLPEAGTLEPKDSGIVPNRDASIPDVLTPHDAMPLKENP